MFLFQLRIIKFLNQVEESKYKNPDQVNKVQVQTNLFNHLVVTATVVNTHYSVVVHEEIEAHTTENVEAVKAGDKEKEGRKIGRAVLILRQISTKKLNA